MQKHRVCVHMTVHNNAPYIEEALRGVLNDPFPDFEVLVFDDGSSDGTGDIARRIAAMDGRVRVEGVSQRLGVAKARAAMIELSDSDYILPFDGDDIFLPGRIGRQIANLEAHPEAAGVYGKAMMIYPDGTGGVIGTSFSPFFLPVANAVCHGATLLRRAAVASAGGYQETGAGADSVGEDYFLWLRLIPHGGLLFENEFRYIYRCHGQQITSTRAHKANLCHDCLRAELLAANRDLADQFMGNGELKLRRADIPRALLTLGLLCQKTEPREPLHQRCLELAARLAPDDGGVLRLKHRLLVLQGDAVGALRLCESLLEKNPDDLVLRLAVYKDMANLLRQLPDAPPEGLKAIEELQANLIDIMRSTPVAIDR